MICWAAPAGFAWGVGSGLGSAGFSSRTGGVGSFSVGSVTGPSDVSFTGSTVWTDSGTGAVVFSSAGLLAFTGSGVGSTFFSSVGSFVSSAESSLTGPTGGSGCGSGSGWVPLLQILLSARVQGQDRSAFQPAHAVQQDLRPCHLHNDSRFLFRSHSSRAWSHSWHRGCFCQKILPSGVRVLCSDPK